MANLDALKQKYQPVIDLAQKRGVAWKNAHIENEKLLMKDPNMIQVGQKIRIPHQDAKEDRTVGLLDSLLGGLPSSFGR